MERDSDRKRTLCSLNVSICKQRPQDAALQNQDWICIVNEEASLIESDGDSMAPGSASQSSVNDVPMDIVENREKSNCPPTPSNKEVQVFCDAAEGSKISAFKESLQVVEAVTQEAQMSKLITPGKRPYGEKAALEVTCVRQSKIRATQSGILDFLTVGGRKQDSKQEKSMKGISKGTEMQMNSEAELHGHTRIQKPFDEKKGNSFASTPLDEKENNSFASTALDEKKNNSLPSTLFPTTDFEVEGYALKKVDDSSKPAGFSCDKKFELIQNNFFLPASKKCNLQKRQEAVIVSFTECTRASKRDIPGLKRCTSNDVKIAEASKPIDLKQPPCRNEDFFRPASKKQKQTMYKEVTTNSESITQVEMKGEKCFEFDLQMEAKLAAEENTQLCAGKPTHPFFSQCKVGPRAYTFWDASPTPAVSRLEDLTPAPPFHINQLDKESDADHESVRFDQFFCSRNMDQPVIKAGISAKSMEILGNLLKRPLVGKSCKAKRLKLCCADHAKNRSGVSLDLTSSCTAVRRNLLWVDAYQPNSPEQVCGNKDSVKYLSDWLQNWQIRRTSWAACSDVDMLHRTVANGENCDEDKVWSEEDSDSGENTSNGYALPNVLVLAGPVGCGKTAAIYASAKAHGYTVIEVNCTENRSGTLIKQRFSEAMESHRVGKWSADATVFPTTKGHFSAESNACRVNTVAPKAKKAELVDGKKNSSSVAAVIHHNDISNSESPSILADLETDAQQRAENDESGDNKEMTILLFEDVDVVFEDDRGFMAAVTQVAESAKRPIILTSNDKEVCLPHNLCSHLLEFNRPSAEDVMSLAYQVCVAEGVVCSPELLQKVVHVCNHDARKVLNYLQFWCQGRRYVRPQSTELENEIAKVEKNERESEMPSSVGLQEESDYDAITYLFDLEAQHRLWPAYIDLDFPCNVTKSVSCKLSERVSEVETQHRADKEKKLVQEIIKKRVLLDKMKRRMTDSPPTVGLNQPYESEEEDNTGAASTTKKLEFVAAPVEDLEEAKTVVQSPALKRKSRRQLTIVTSESDDDTPDTDRDEQHLHLEPKPLSSLTSPRTSGEMGSTKGKDAPVSSDLHAEASKELHSSTSKKCPHEELGPNQASKELHSSPSKSPHEELGINQAAPCRFPNTSESVYNLWASFRICRKNKDEFLLSPASKEFLSVVSSLSDLADNLSACDIMSCVHSYKQKNKASMFLSHGNPEYCDWAPICAQIAHESFQMCVQDARKVAGVEHEDRGMISLEDMMLAANDPFTLGKKLAADEKLKNQGKTFHGQADPLSEEQSQIRLQKKASLQSEVFAELPLPAQRSLQGAAFYEHLSFLARIGHLEQARCALGPTRLRARVSQSLFCSHPWDLSENSINNLLSFGTYGKALLDDKRLPLRS